MTRNEREETANQLFETWRDGNRNHMRRSLERLSLADAVSVAALMLESATDRRELLSLVESLQCLKG